MIGYQVSFNPVSKQFEASDIPIFFKEGMKEVYDTYKNACFAANTLNAKTATENIQATKLPV